MDAQAQAQKLRFLEEFMRVSDEVIIAKLSDLLRTERVKRAESLRKMNHEELAEKLNRAEEDVKAGRVYSQEEIEEYFEDRRSRG